MPSTPLFNPQDFFAQRTPSLTGGAVILYVIGIVAVASAVPFADQFASIEFSPSLLIISVLVGGGIGAIAIWAVSTMLVYIYIVTGSWRIRISETNSSEHWVGILTALVCEYDFYGDCLDSSFRWRTPNA